MGFDAALEVEDLEYDFDSLAKKFVDPATGETRFPTLVGAKGVTPEPSDEAVQKLQRNLANATKSVLPEGVDATDQQAVAKAMADLPDEAFAKAESAILDALAELTQGYPTRDQLAALPFRHKRGYIKWLQGQLMSPESSTGGTNS